LSGGNGEDYPWQNVHVSPSQQMSWHNGAMLYGGSTNRRIMVQYSDKEDPISKIN
jgi:hypothetical protein